MPDNTTPSGPPMGDARFASTRWSIVVAAAGTDSEASAHALARLCETYWGPLYAFARRSGHQPDMAQDLTQGFFARLLEKRDIGQATPERGRFRSFLLGAFKHYIANAHKRDVALKRGGGAVTLPLEFEHAEEFYTREPAETRTPETLYERRWVLTLIDKVLLDLRDNYEQSGKGEIFEQLKPFLTEESSEAGYRELSQRLGLSETMLRSAVHRMRRRYRDLLRQAVADTLTDPVDIEDEIRFLFSALSR